MAVTTWLAPVRLANMVPVLTVVVAFLTWLSLYSYGKLKKLEGKTMVAFLSPNTVAFVFRLMETLEWSGLSVKEVVTGTEVMFT